MIADLKMRRATPRDRDGLRQMQELSLRTLGASCYAPETLDTFIATVGTMDDALLEEGLFNMVTSGGRIVACGGWSRRTRCVAA